MSIRDATQADAQLVRSLMEDFNAKLGQPDAPLPPLEKQGERLDRSDLFQKTDGLRFCELSPRAGNEIEITAWLPQTRGLTPDKALDQAALAQLLTAALDELVARTPKAIDWQCWGALTDELSAAWATFFNGRARREIVRFGPGEPVHGLVRDLLEVGHAL